MIHTGSCHCKAVEFEAPIDLANTVRCNCSFCAKVRNWAVRISDPTALKITKGESEIAEYRFAPERPVWHAFCRNCGVRLWSAGTLPTSGEFVSVSVVTLDDLSPAELDELNIWYADGKHDAWQNTPAHHAYL